MEISNFIWNEDGQPVTLSPESSPLDESPGFESALSPEILNNITQTHPSLRKYIFKQKELEVDLRLKGAIQTTTGCGIQPPRKWIFFSK
ncbi:MAG: hypothetical protein R2769_01340 [Saprospiraceae bacterium]